MQELKLYYSASCPYCLKVLRFIEAQGIKPDLASVAEAKNHKRLVEEGGKYQVPCLFIDGEALYESDDIIAYLKNRFVN